MSTVTTEALESQLDRLAAFDPTSIPVISLYLNLQADQHGRDNYDAFLRKELTARVRSYPLRSPERESLERDSERIGDYLSRELDRSANGVAIFACAGKDGFFEAIQTAAPIDRHELYVHYQPHIYTLARIAEQFSRYATVVADTNSARIFVLGLNATEVSDVVTSVKANKTRVGGWSQARFQRHVENYWLQHAKEVVARLEKIVREERIDRVLLAGDEVVIPLLREQLTPMLIEKVVDVLRLDMDTPEHTILKESLEAMRHHDRLTDSEEVAALIGEWRSGGLAVMGVHDALAALLNGQVDELVISTVIEQDPAQVEDLAAMLLPDVAAAGPDAVRNIQIADELVTRARQSGASVRFIEDAELLKDYGGAGARLRYLV